METHAPAFVFPHTRIRIATERPTEFTDVTEAIQERATEASPAPRPGEFSLAAIGEGRR